MSNILVTGANGFIGKHLVPYLIAQGHYVKAAVWQPSSALACDQVIVNRFDENSNWQDALANIDCVIHLAARVHIMDSQKEFDNKKFIKINSEATRHLALQAAQYGVQRFIFLSTIKVNGEATSTHKPFTENDSPIPEDMYAESKLLAERYLKEISASSNLTTIVIRPPLVYGPGVKANFLKLIQSIEKGYPMPFGKISNQRSFIYIDNLIHAIQTLVSAPINSHSCFLVCDDKTWSLPDLIKQIALNLQQKPRLFSIPVFLIRILLTLLGKKRTADRLINSLLIDNQGLKTHSDWAPLVSAEEGIARTVEWYKSTSS